MSLRWDTSLEWDKTNLIALKFLWFSPLFLSCFIAHTERQGSIGLLQARFLRMQLAKYRETTFCIQGVSHF